MTQTDQRLKEEIKKIIYDNFNNILSNDIGVNALISLISQEKRKYALEIEEKINLWIKEWAYLEDNKA